MTKYSEYSPIGGSFWQKDSYATIHYDSAPRPQRSCFANRNVHTYLICRIFMFEKKIFEAMISLIYDGIIRWYVCIWKLEALTLFVFRGQSLTTYLYLSEYRRAYCGEIISESRFWFSFTTYFPKRYFYNFHD